MADYDSNDYRERRIDSDLTSNVEFNGGADNMPGFRLEDVAYVLAALMGENDGPDFHWIIAMKDHTYAYVTGGCDYTGWDCQSSGRAQIFPTLRAALAETEKTDNFSEAVAEIRRLLTMQLTGERSFGESTPSRY